MKTHRKLHIAFLVSFAIFSPNISSAGDAETGSITGQLSDDGGEVVAGAEVSALKGSAGLVGRTKTDAGGAYKLELPPGTYSVRFSAAGFKRAELRNIVVGAGEIRTVAATLVPGAETELVAEEWNPLPDLEEEVENDSAAETSVKSIPLSSRNYTQAAGLASGVSSQVSNATAMGMNSQGVQVGSGTVSNYMMDGASVAASTGGADAPAVPNPDAIESNSVQSWSYSTGPERHAGANISVVTKSGSNAFHGTLFEFVRNDIFNANEFFLKSKGAPRPVLKQNQFGFSLGGLIKRERAFFFVAYQGTRQRNGIAMAGYSPNARLAPLPETRNRATVGAAMCAANHAGDKDFLTLQGGVQVACDGSNVNPVAVNLLNLKLANGAYLIPGSGSTTFQTVPRSIPASFREDQVLINTDFVFSAKQKLTQKFFFGRDPQTYSFTGGPTALPGSPLQYLSGNIYGVLKLSSTLTAELQNELRVSGQHDFLRHTPQVPFRNEQVGIASIIPQVNTLDSIEISGMFALGGGNIWDANSVNQYQLADQISWIHGRHSIRTGFEINRRQWNVRAPAYARGSLSLTSFADFLLGLPGCPPGSANCSVDNPIVNGVVTNGSPFSNIYGSVGAGGSVANVTAPAGIQHGFRYSDGSAYVQDEFRILPRLTLTAGVRWDYLGFPSDSTGNNTNFWPSLANAWSVPPAGGTYAGYVVPSNLSGSLPSGVVRNAGKTPMAGDGVWKNFAPRFSFSAQPFAKSNLVIRGGYGLFYDRPDAWIMEQQPMASVPYAVPVGGSGQANYQATLAQPYPQASLGWGTPRAVNFSTGESTNLTLGVLDEKFAAPFTQKWNLEIQQQFPGGLTFVAGYAGAHSIHLQNMRQLNGARLASPESPVNGITTSTVKNAGLRVPYLGIAANGLNAEQTQGSAKYNALQVAVREQARNGFHAQAAFMFSKTLTTLGAAPTLPGTPYQLASYGMNSNDPLNARQQYGRSKHTAPMRLAVNYGWNFPWKTQGMTGWLLNGWGVSGTMVIQSGTPMTLSDSRGGTIYGSAGYSRAQLCAGMSAKDVPTSGGVKDRLNAYFNTAAICAPPAVGDGTGFGNSSIGFILGPGQANTDVAVSKRADIKDSKVEFRVEFFNALNHPQFSNPNQNVSDGPFGKITSTSVNPRLIQFALKYSF